MKYAIIALALVSLACSKKETPAETLASGGTNVTPKAEAEGTALAPSADPPVVELIEAGRPPLRKIRWQFSKGTDEVLKMKSAYAFKVQQGAKPESANVLPTMLQTIDIVIKDVSADGLAEVAFEVRDDAAIETPNVTPGLWVTPVKGTTGTYKIDSAGVVTDFALTRPPTLPPQADLEYVENLLRLMVFPVPEQPIGVGAQWTVTQVIEKRGIPMNEQVTLELVELAGSEITLTFELESSGSIETHIGKPPAEALRTQDYRWDANGRTKSSLTTLVPRLSTFGNEAALHSKVVKPNGEPDPMEVHMSVERKVEMRSE